MNNTNVDTEQRQKVTEQLTEVWGKFLSYLTDMMCAETPEPIDRMCVDIHVKVEFNGDERTMTVRAYPCGETMVL